MGRVYISAPKTEDPSVYQWSVPKKNKQRGWGNVFLNTSLKLGLSWKFWKTWRSQQVTFHKVCHTPWKPSRPKQKTPRLFVDYPCRFHSFSNTGFLSQQPSYIQYNVLKGGTEGFYFLIEEISKTIY